MNTAMRRETGFVPNERTVRLRRRPNIPGSRLPRSLKGLDAARDRAIATAHKPRFAPGAGWSYSDTNYYVLGLIVEAATGHLLAHELRERILVPLRLRGTSFDSAPRITGHYAHGYFLHPLEDVSVGSPSVLWAAGALVSNADDLARFYHALLGGGLVRPDLLRVMETVVTPAPGFSYGLGLQKLREPCGSVWGHTGGSPSYVANALNSKDGQRQIVVLVNGTAASLSAPVNGLQFFHLPKPRRGRGRIVDHAGLLPLVDPRFG